MSYTHGRSANYWIIEDYGYSTGGESKSLPRYSFVRPIDPIYLPVHIKDRWPVTDLETYTFAYTSQGIIPIPLKLILAV